MVNVIRKILSFLISVIFLCCSFFLFSCAKIYDSVEYNFFNTLVRVQVEDKKLSSQVKSDLTTLFSQIERDFDRKNQNSLVYKYNGALPNQIIELNHYQREVMDLSVLANQYTLGLFNPAIYPLLEVWQFAPNYPVLDFAPPSNTQIQDALDRTCDFNQIQFDSQNKKLTKYNQSQLDFGGIVKGYAVDLAGKILKDNGYEKGYISIGASSLYILHAPTLSVRSPLSLNQNLLEVNLSALADFSLSTSGDYEKYYIDSFTGQKYSHVIDVNTGYPTATGVKSVTIIGGNGAFSDAVTTACLLLEHTPLSPYNSPLAEFSKKIIADNKAQMVFAVYSKEGVNQIITNAKKGEEFTLFDNQFEVVNI